MTDRQPRRLVWAAIVLAWLAISLGSAGLGVVVTLAGRAAWSLAESPRGEPPGPEFLLLAVAVAVPAFLIAGIVAFAPAHRVYTISLAAGAVLLAALVAARVQAGVASPLPDVLGAVLARPLEALAVVLTNVPDILLACLVVVASLVARRTSTPSR